MLFLRSVHYYGDYIAFDRHMMIFYPAEAQHVLIHELKLKNNK